MLYLEHNVCFGFFPKKVVKKELRNMSHSTNRTFTCPCGKVFTGTIYEYVNTVQSPQLRYIVLAGLLNVSICPACGRRAAVATPFLYSDPPHRLLAYVYPRADTPEEVRTMILEKLHSAYMDATTMQEEEVSPLRVVFGLDQFNILINGLLPPEERLGRLALSTRSSDEAERGQFLDIARKLSSEMGCCIEVEDLSDEYTVWLYGSRRQIGALMRELAPGG
jgi:hypothetical protein